MNSQVNFFRRPRNFTTFITKSVVSSRITSLISYFIYSIALAVIRFNIKTRFSPPPMKTSHIDLRGAD